MGEQIPNKDSSDFNVTKDVGFPMTNEGQSCPGKNIYNQFSFSNRFCNV